LHPPLPKVFWGIAINPEFNRNSEGWITCSFGVHDSGEGSWVKFKDGMCLDSIDEDSSTLDMTFAWRVLVFMMEEVCLSRKFSRNFTCPVIGLCVKWPLTVMPRHRSTSMSIHNKRVTTICYRVKTSLG
jgi:hypothetical protein